MAKGGLNAMCDIMEKIAKEERMEGIAEGKLETLFELVKDGILTVSDAAQRANMSETVFTENMKKVK
jgi:hypothetical protein